MSHATAPGLQKEVFLIPSLPQDKDGTVRYYIAMAPKTLHAEDAQHAREEAPELPYVNWKKSPGLRRLYMYATVIMVASATTGYDGCVSLQAHHIDR